MITTMTAALQAALAGRSRRPRQLLEINFPTSGTLYLSDQPLGVADGLDHEYLPLVEDWGALAASTGDARARDHGLIRQCSITLWNGGDTPFSDYFISNPAETTEVLLYQWAVGLTDADKFLIDRFFIADPIEFNEASRLLTLDLVSLPWRWEMPIGSVVTRADWPYADAGEIGNAIPLALGSPGQIPAIKAKVAMACTLANSILAGDATIPVNEDLDTIGFPASGALQLDEERITFSGRTAGSFTGCGRGTGGTVADQHLRNAEIVEHLTDHTFVLCEGPVVSIGNVLVEGYPAPAGSYTVDAAADPARVVFNTQPYYEKYSSGSKFLEMQFDATGAGNTALWPAYAYDTDETASGALVCAANPQLVVTQTDANEDRGQILKAYLSVAAFTVGWYAVDYVEVSVSGLGVIGQLSRPDSADQMSIDGDVDIDHGHLHSTGAAHFHTYTDPNFSSVSPNHNHDLSIAFSEIRTDIGGFPIGTWIEKSGSDWTIDYITFPEYSNNGVWVEYTLDWYVAGYAPPIIELVIAIGGTVYGIPLNSAGTTTVYIGSGDHGINPFIKYKTTYGDTCKFKLSMCAIIWHAVNSVQNRAATVTTSKSLAGSVLGQGADNNDDPIKAYDDVHDLATGNSPLNINAQDNPGRTVVDLFDLTPAVNFDWSWFTGRTVTLRYVSTGENKDVYVLHTHFQIEFAPKEIVFSDEISAEVVGQLTTPAECIEYLLTDKAGVTAGLIDGDSFTAAAASHLAASYVLDGLLPGDMSVRDAIKAICRQTHSRLFTNAGLIRLVAKTATPPIAKALSGAAGDLQLRSIAVSKQPLADISNRIDLAYNFDQIGGGYKSMVRAENADSIANYGLHYLPDNYRFDLIRSAEMAAGVAGYYLAVDGQPATWYTFSGYLPQLALEPEDGIQLTASFHGLTAASLVVRGIQRRFGSGKNGQINLLTFTAEQHNYGEAEIFGIYTDLAPEVLPGELGSAVVGLDHLANIDLAIL